MFSDTSGLFDKSPLYDMCLFKKKLDEYSVNIPTIHSSIKNRREWDPYTLMGGTSAAIAGPDYVILASDSRMSQHDINIMTRECQKIHVLSDKIMMNFAGFYGDVLQLKRLLMMRLNHYKFTYNHEMPVDLFATMLSRTLYYRRFFPYYTGCILAGITENGEGAIYDYDSIGTLKRSKYAATGTGFGTLETYFDVTFDKCTIEPEKRPKEPLTLEQAKTLLRDAFRVLAERDTNTGDSVQLVCMVSADKTEPKSETIPLRED